MISWSRWISTQHTGVLQVTAVMNQPAIMTALGQRTFISSTGNIVEPNGSSSNKISVWLCLYQECSKWDGGPGVLEAEHSANYSSVFDIPVVIADCAPSSIVENLQSAKCRGTTTQSDDWSCGVKPVTYCDNRLKPLKLVPSKGVSPEFQ